MSDLAALRARRQHRLPRLARVLSCLVALHLLAACAGPAASRLADASPAEPNGMAESDERRILVMLRAVPPHYRAKAAYAEDYGTRAPASARRDAERVARDYGLVLVGDWPMPALGVNCFVMRAAAGVELSPLIDRLAGDPRVESTQQFNAFRALGYDDPLLSMQPGDRLWHLEQLHRGTTGRNVTVAVIDSGVDTTHPDLAGKIALAQNFVDGSEYAGEMHGTAVSGIVAARPGNGMGIAGIAPDTRILALRACWQGERRGDGASCNSFTLAKALQYALAHGADVINMSLGGPRDRLIERLIDVALERSITIVAAVDPSDPAGGFPASHPGVLSVASEDMTTPIPSALFAPGQDIPTTMPGGRFGFATGSSFAAAHVSGVVALLRQVAPGIRPAALRTALAGPVQVGTVRGSPRMVDPCSAIASAGVRCGCGCPSAALTAASVER